MINDSMYFSFYDTATFRYTTSFKCLLHDKSGIDFSIKDSRNPD